ncbi:MAG: chromate efflux transporter [Gammaproteobacteria bacterium]|nr:chromate efflux transporter [Gammaproteobacteria bacterium]
MSTAPTPVPTTPPAPVSFWEAFKYWLKLGFISFGGPAGQISMMHQELVEKRRWISEHRFLHALNYCMVLPGPEATQLAIYIGWLMHGVLGGIIAGILFFLPGMALLAALSWIYIAFGDVPAVAGVLYGIKPAVTAIVVFAAYRIGSKALKNGVLWGLAAAAFVAIFAFDMPFPAIVLAAAILGAIGGRLLPDKFKTGGGHGASNKTYGPALIDDDTPVPNYARFRWSRVVAFLAAGLAIGIGVFGVLLALYGWQGTLTQMGWFFTKAAFLTIGGAYAVLPYVYQGGVEHYGWLTGPQMIDGLALGETTPGPLIMVITYVGFIGGWTKQVFGADWLALGGIAGALVATFFTFLPSFLFVLVGGPAIEASRRDIKLSAPLTGITAAVVGVILNLAVFFAWHVLWPQASAAAPFAGRLEWFSLAVGIAAFLALWRYKLDIMKVIGACAVAGLAWVFLLKPLFV